MHTYPCWIPLALATTLIGQLVVAAQDWRTVDDFAVAGGNAEAHGLAVDAAGRVYVVGTANGHGIVRYSADGGSTWSTRDDFVYRSGTNHPSGTNNLFNAITINHQGDLFVGGASAAFVGGVAAGHWIVRRSRDQGVSWETVDDFFEPRNGPMEGTNGAVYSLSTDGQGRVYGAGLMLPTGPSYLRWWVRGSDNWGTNWDTKLVLFSGYTGVSQISWAGEDVCVTGGVSDGDSTTGLILRSSDYGATWSTNFEATNEVYYAIASDSAGNIYSAGNSWNSNSYDWIVRKAAPGGTNWTIIDRSTYQDTCGCGVSHPYPHSVAIDPARNICVAGEFQERWVIYATNSATYGAYQTWFVRQYSVATHQWNTTDQFSYSTNMPAVALGAATAPNGSTFVVGYGTSDSGQRRWVVRKRAGAVTPPRLQIASGDRSVTVFWPAACTNCVIEWTDSMDINQPWQTFYGKASVVNGQNTVTFDLTPGPRLFRLKTMGE